MPIYILMDSKERRVCVGALFGTNRDSEQRNYQSSLYRILVHYATLRRAVG
jgi:hypothetical protein